MNKKRWSGPSYPLMRIFKFPQKFSSMISRNNTHVTAEFVSAIDEVVLEECFIFLKLLDESGKNPNFMKILWNDLIE